MIRKIIHLQKMALTKIIHQMLLVMNKLTIVRLWLAWDLHLYLYSYSKCTAYIYICTSYLWLCLYISKLVFLSCSLVLQVYSRSRLLSMDIEVSQGYTLHRTSACAVGQKIFVQRLSPKRVRQIENRARYTSTVVRPQPVSQTLLPNFRGSGSETNFCFAWFLFFFFSLFLFLFSFLFFFFQF